VIRVVTVRYNDSSCVKQIVFIGFCLILLYSDLKISEFPFSILLRFLYVSSGMCTNEKKKSVSNTSSTRIKGCVLHVTAICTLLDINFSQF
jgi:hypothetical protein